MQTIARKIYPSLDVAKFGCALLIIAAHFASEQGHFPTVIDYGFSIYIIAVPFFFCCSGFLFFDKFRRLAEPSEKKAYFVKYIKRILLMYLAWSAVYFVFVAIGWITEGVTVQEVLHYLHTSLFFSTYATIWFLPALAVGVAMVYLLQKFLSMEWIFAISLLFYIIGSFGYSYAPALDKIPVLHDAYQVYDAVFISSRNGVFNGFPLIALGALVAKRQGQAEEKRRGGLYFLGMAVCGAGVVLEAFWVKRHLNPTGMDTVFMLLPFTYFLLKWLLTVRLQERKAYALMRNLSLLMFVSQRLFLSALPSVFPDAFGLLWSNSYVGLLLTLGLVTGFSLLVVKLTPRLHFLKVLW